MVPDVVLPDQLFAISFFKCLTKKDELNTVVLYYVT